MDTDTLVKLLEGLEKKQYSAVAQNFTQNNKRLKISGFSSIDKAPIRLIANTAKTSTPFRVALLRSISAVLLIQKDIDINKEISIILNELPKDQWLGLAALLFLSDNSDYHIKAKTIVSNYTTSQQGASGSIAMQSSIQKGDKGDKKEDKFREKYLKAKSELFELTKKLSDQETQLYTGRNKIAELEQTVHELKQRESSYLTQLEAIKFENQSLKNTLGKAEKKIDDPQKVISAGPRIKVYAPGCKDIIGRYSQDTAINFDIPLSAPDEKALDEFDEIWLCQNALSFGVFRKLSRWKSLDSKKVLVFPSTTELLIYAKKTFGNN